MDPVLMMRLEKGKRRGKQVRCSNMQTVLYLTLEIRICAQWISLPSEKKIKGLREPLSRGLFLADLLNTQSHNFGFDPPVG